MSGIEVHGYAIVSADDRIADAQGAMPAALRNDADWAYFQAGLDRADFLAIGRKSHEATPNPKGRRRIVMSRAAQGLERRPDGLWWNPLSLAFADLMAALAPGGARVAVPGGQAAFDLFLGVGYAGFHLSRAGRVTLPGGRGLFAACEAGANAATVLHEAGLNPDPTLELDRQAGVTLTVWRPAAVSAIARSAAPPPRAG